MMYPWAMLVLGLTVGAALMKWHDERKTQRLRQVTAELLEAMEESIPVMSTRVALLVSRAWGLLWR